MTANAALVPPARADMAQVFHALSDETRLAVLDLLRGGERCVCDLQNAVDAAQSRLSFHLRVLKDAGLVTDRKEGRWSYYSLNAARLDDARVALGTLVIPTSNSSAALKLHSLERRPRLAGTQRARRGVVRSGDCC